MNVLLTGATGFIGETLIARLLDRGHYVSILTRKVRPRADRNVGQYFWEMKGPAPAEPLEWADAIIHLAGEPIAQRWNDEVKRKIRESRVDGTRHLVEGIARIANRPQVLISGSATGYFGDRGGEVLTEDSRPGTGFLPDVCVAWEREARKAEEYGLRVAVVRTGIVLHPSGGALKQMLPPFKLGVGGPIGSGEQWMSWIHRDDLISLFVFVLEHESVAGAVNGAAPNPVPNAEFTQALGRAVHRPAVIPVPGFALKLLFGEMATVLLEGQRVIPAAAQRAGFTFEHPNLTGAFADLLR
jgi:uncharacterized protein (TIGR01777 family)